MADNNQTDTGAVTNAAVAPVVAPVTENAAETVAVEKLVLQRILSELNSLKEQVQQHEQTASQDQIRKIEALRASGKLVKSVKLRRFNGKLVLGWKTVKDNVWVADGKIHEIQEIKVFFEDDSEEDTTLLQFTRGCTYEPYEVIKEAQTATGSVEYVVEVEGGKALTITAQFVN